MSMLIFQLAFGEMVAGRICSFLVSSDSMACYQQTHCPYYDNTKIIKSGICEEAETGNIFHNQLWSCDGSNGYNLIDTTDNLDPWSGYWGYALNEANGTTSSVLILRL